jgi:copper resistance protein D
VIRTARAVILLLTFLVLLAQLLVWSQDHPAQDDHAGMDMAMPMSMPMPANGPTPALLLKWKLESEGNHHLIGFFVALGGAFILLQDSLKKRFPAVRYAWPVCFLLSGIFVLVYSDTELWPFGPKPWIQGTISNPEVIQHKVFAIILLGLGLIEVLRVRGVLTAMWAAWVFPVLAIAGSALLLFHSHHSGMRGPNHMAIMARIQAEHLSYAATGFGIGLTKGLAEVDTRWQTIFAKLWPTLMIVLGVLLMFYVE